MPGWGTTGDILFLSAGGYHHHLGFNTWKSAGGAAAARRRHGPAPRRAPLPDARGPGRRRCGACRPSTGRSARLADHGTHEAIYISDPDGNDLELCWDRPFEQWPRDDDGHAAAEFGDLDVERLLSEA